MHACDQHTKENLFVTSTDLLSATRPCAKIRATVVYVHIEGEGGDDALTCGTAAESVISSQEHAEEPACNTTRINAYYPILAWTV